ncbi:MAG: hypothetical protein OXP71_02810 [Candidatus Poribacteria bacterium]|nr:hypothetical protein [Candidatus Poribacteria bacterium]
MKTSAHGTALIETDTFKVAGDTTGGFADAGFGVIVAASVLGGGVSGGVRPQDLTATIEIIITTITKIPTARSAQSRLVKS